MEATEGGSIDGVYEGRYTCLMISSRSGHLDICRLLIDKGAQVEARNRYDRTPLHYAARYGHVEIVRLLCDHGADVEARHNDGSRPLHWAAYNGHISIVKELIEVRNAVINARNDDGETALRLARDRGKADIPAYFVSHGGII